MEIFEDKGCLWWLLIGWWAFPILLILYGIKTTAEKAATAYIIK